MAAMVARDVVRCGRIDARDPAFGATERKHAVRAEGPTDLRSGGDGRKLHAGCRRSCLHVVEAHLMLRALINWFRDFTLPFPLFDETEE